VKGKEKGIASCYENLFVINWCEAAVKYYLVPVWEMRRKREYFLFSFFLLAV